MLCLEPRLDSAIDIVFDRGIMDRIYSNGSFHGQTSYSSCFFVGQSGLKLPQLPAFYTACFYGTAMKLRHYLGVFHQPNFKALVTNETNGKHYSIQRRPLFKVFEIHHFLGHVILAWAERLH